MGCEHS